MPEWFWGGVVFLVFFFFFPFLSFLAGSGGGREILRSGYKFLYDEWMKVSRMSGFDNGN